MIQRVCGGYIVCRKDTPPEEKVPITQVLDDMYGDKGPISWAARDYYYINYASPEERQLMDAEQKFENIFSKVFIAFCALVFVAAVILTFYKGD